MSGIFNIIVLEAAGFFAVPADIDNLMVVMGCSSAGSGQSPFYLSGSAANVGVGYGDGPDLLTQVIEQRQDNGSGIKKPAAFYTLPVTGHGSYGAVDNTGVTGTALFAVDATSYPLSTFNKAWIKVITGGVVGVSGITIQHSEDDGVNWSNTIGLGTLDYYLVPNTGVKWTVAEGTTDLTALNTLIDQIYTKQNAHVILTAGTVHSGADNADVVSIAAATSTATRVARINALRAAYELHRVKGSGAGIHINVAGDAVNAITAPVATDDESALVLALDMKAKLNFHEASVVFHTIADGANNVTAPAPSAGTLIAGDVAKVRTLAPTPSTADLDTALAALAVGPLDIGLIAFDFPVTASIAVHITTGLNLLKAQGKLVTAICRTRLPDFENSETEATWLAAVAADFANFNDSRIHVRATYCVNIDAMTTRAYLRSDVAQFAADAVRVGRAVWPCAPADQQAPGTSLIDSTGATVGHDEGPRGAATGLSNDTLGNRFGCQQRLPMPTVREAVYNTVPWVCYASSERIRNLMSRRLANAMERVAVAAALPLLGASPPNGLFFTATSPTTGILTDASRTKAQGLIFQAVSAAFSNEIGNAADAALDTGLIQVSSAVTVSGQNILALAFTIAPSFPGYAKDLTFTLAVKVSA